MRTHTATVALVLAACSVESSRLGDRDLEGEPGAESIDAAPADSRVAEQEAGTDAGVDPVDALPIREAGGDGFADAAVDARAIAPASAKLFDDFESYPMNGKPSGAWKALTSGTGALTIDNVHVFSGQRAVHVTIKKFAADSSGLIETKPAAVFPAPNHTYFGRMMIFIPSVPGNRHWTMILGIGPSAPGTPATNVVNYGFGINNGSFWQSEYFKPEGFVDYGYQDFNNLTPVVQAKWACVEWSMDALQRKLRLWVDNVAIDSVSVNGQGYANQTPWNGPAFETVRLGINSYNPGLAFDTDLWIDDVALGHARIGCP